MRRWRLAAAGLRQRHAAGASTRPRVPLFAASHRRLCAVSARRRRPDDLRPCAAAAAPPRRRPRRLRSMQPRSRRRPAGQGPMSLPNRRRLGAAPRAAGAASSPLPPLAAPPPRHRQPPSQRRGGSRPPRARLAAPTEAASWPAAGAVARLGLTTALLPASFPPRHLAGRSSPTPSRKPLLRNPAVSVLPPRSTAATRPGRPGPQKPAQMLLRRRQRADAGALGGAHGRLVHAGVPSD